MKKDAENVNGTDSLPMGEDPITSDFHKRAEDLVRSMTLEEKIAQMMYNAPAIPRLGIPPYHWWNECLHGVARAGIATVFPQAIGLAATFDTELIYRVATVISDEARAKHHKAVSEGDFGRYKGLTFWSPNINIFRDPRWGRGQETYGECPFLTSMIGRAFVKGLQGDHPVYLKTVATPKHYVAHSGPEKLRHKFNAIVDPADLFGTYLIAFRECIDAGAYSIMGAYSRTNGEPCCASDYLLNKLLRKFLGFKGYVVSDCGAIADLHKHHKVTSDAAESAALAVKSGCDLNCGRTYSALKEAVERGLITEKEIDTAVKRLMLARLKLGMFDPPGKVPYTSIPYNINDHPKHRKLALITAEKSFVLLKNNGILPIKPEKHMKIAVIGPNADSLDVLLGNYHGTPSSYSTVLKGFKRYVSEYRPDVEILYTRGCSLTGKFGDKRRIRKAVELARKSDITVICAGISPKLEGEERFGGKDDRESLDIPKIQTELIEKIAETGVPVILLIFGGSPLTIGKFHDDDRIGAIIELWYPGEEGGYAVARTVFGQSSPAGRLPVTFVESVDDLPPFTSYSMIGRTYRFMKKTPLYPFGYGLSYTDFKYTGVAIRSSPLSISDLIKKTEYIHVSVAVSNIGQNPSDEVVQLYINYGDLEGYRVPRYQLIGFKRIFLQPGESVNVDIAVHYRWLALYNKDGKPYIPCCKATLFIGGSLPDRRSVELTGRRPVNVGLELTGKDTVIKYVPFDAKNSG